MFKRDPGVQGSATSYLMHWEQAIVLIFYNNSKHSLLILTSNKNASNQFSGFFLEECLQHIKGVTHGNYVSCSLKILLTCDIVQYFLLSLRNKDCTKPRTIFRIFLTCAFANFFSNRSRSFSVCCRRLLSSTMSPFNEARAAKWSWKRKETN